LDNNLYKLAAIATIVATIIAAWQLFDHRQIASSSVNSKRVASETAVTTLLDKEKAAINLSLDTPEYKGERNWLFEMYRTAQSMPYVESKSNALKRVVAVSLESGDFNMALIAAKESPYSTTEDELLNEIVSAAVQRKETIGYAALAADNMQYYASRDSALEKILGAYEQFSKQQQPRAGEQSQVPAKKPSAADH
jgi:hypothetical protein